MQADQKFIRAVPTNMITGFLGVGKTSAILNLLKHKPATETWAVLVNEFGEIGVDGSLFQGQHPEEQRVFVREVAGGCMCCAAGLPMQIALNQLLMRARPDRLLIEPTGLGHPLEVLQVLSGEYYREVLSLQKTITLVDARQLSDPRYTDHPTFNQQLALADIVVANKADLYQPEDHAALAAYTSAQLEKGVSVFITEQGQLDPNWLHGATATQQHLQLHLQRHLKPPHNPVASTQPAVAEINAEAIPEQGYLSAINQAEGFHSQGWRFAADQRFDYDTLLAWLTGLNVERLKAVAITHKGIFAYNLTADTLSEVELDECLESRIEIIANELDSNWETALLSCLIAK